MKKLFLKLGLLILLYLGIFTPLSWYYDSYYQENLDLCDKADWILSLSGRQYDDGFIGSSRAYNMLNLVAYEEESGKTAINLATSGSSFAENYLLLQQFYEKGNRLKRLFIQADIYGLDSHAAYSYPFHEYKYLPYLSEDTVSAIIRDNSRFSRFLIWKYVPFAKYMEFSNHYDFYKTFRGGFQCTESEFDVSKGSLIHQDVYTNFKDKQPQKYGLNSLDIKYLKLLIQLGQDKGVEVVLYMAPEYKDYLLHQLNRKELLNEIQVLANQYEVPFLRFEMNTISQNKDYFRDYTHLNAEGVTAFTHVLIQHQALHTE